MIMSIARFGGFIITLMDGIRWKLPLTCFAKVSPRFFPMVSEKFDRLRLFLHFMSNMILTESLTNKDGR